jgi:hypothetical protein
MMNNLSNLIVSGHTDLGGLMIKPARLSNKNTYLNAQRSGDLNESEFKALLSKPTIKLFNPYTNSHMSTGGNRYAAILSELTARVNLIGGTEDAESTIAFVPEEDASVLMATTPKRSPSVNKRSSKNKNSPVRKN